MAAAIHVTSAKKCSATEKPHADADVHPDPDILLMVYSAYAIDTAVRSLGRYLGSLQMVNIACLT